MKRIDWMQVVKDAKYKYTIGNGGTKMYIYRNFSLCPFMIVSLFTHAVVIHR